MKKSPQPHRLQKTLMAAIGKAMRVVQSPAALALTVLFALTRMAVAQPTVGAINVAGIMLCTNTQLTCTITSSSSTITNVSLSYTTTLLGGANSTSVTTNLNSHTTGLGTATATVSYPLVTNVIYTLMTLTALDDTGASGTTNGLVSGAPEVLDTLEPSLVIEAEDYNYTNGGYMNTPPNGGLAAYFGLVGEANIDFQWQASTGPATYYRTTDAAGGLGPQVETTGNNFLLKPQKFWTAVANGDTTDIPVEIGYNSTGNWFDYTRDFGSAPTNSAPNGTYNIWVFLSDDDAANPSIFLSEVTSPANTSNQTTSAQIGVFNLTDANWNNYYYVPMTDQFGTLASVTLSGHETLRCTVAGEANIDFFMLVPATPVVTPILQHIFPNGPFALTNALSFTVGAANGAGIPASGINLVLNGEPVTSEVKLTGATNSWTGTVAIQSNTIYTGTLTVSNSAGLISSFAFSFDTFDANNFQWEADDYDFSTNNGTAWISGLFIDNPVPSADTTASATGHEATNSYFNFPMDFTPALDKAGMGALAQQNIDYYAQSIQPTNSGSDYYRPDNQGSQPATDYVRPKFKAAQTKFGDPNIGLFNIGWTTKGDWENYTHHYPAGKFNVYARLAGGNGAYGVTQSDPTMLALVTNGVGTATQDYTVLGTFSDPNANGWQSYHWIPLVDDGGNLVTVTLGGLQTLKVISGGNVNNQFYMLVPQTLSTVPLLLSAYPDGKHPFEATNSFSFEVTSASGASIASSGISLTLNGVDVSGELTLSSSSTNWTGSIPLLPNTPYLAVLTVSNSAGGLSVFTKSFDTFDINNYQWEACDYDFTAGGVSALFIDNPVPTCDVNAVGVGELETNSYFGSPGDISGAIAISGVDFFDQNPQTGTAGVNDYYRPDGQGSQPATDYLRPKFLAAQVEFGDNNIGTFNLGYTSTGDWENYTRHYPAGSFNVWGRIAGGNGPWKGTTLSMVTSGVGSSNQTVSYIGSFADPNANGWQSYHWVQLVNTNTGNVAVVTLGGKSTMRITCGGNVNEQYYMLTPAAAVSTGPRIGAALVAGQLSITIPTATGHNYQLVYSSVLTTNKSAWSAIGSGIVGDGSVHTVTETLTGTQGYYEIKVQ